MSDRERLQRKLLRELEDLPEEQLQAVLEFVGSLRRKPTDGGNADFDPARDPILAYAGGVSLGSLAKDIDAALYGP